MSDSSKVELKMKNDCLQLDHIVRIIKNYQMSLNQTKVVDYSDAESKGFRPHWRRQLMNWVLDFHVHWNLSITAVHFAASLLDRFLSTYKINKGILQLAAVACIFISSKINDTRFISVSNLAQLADGIYTTDDIKNMELEILSAFNWNINIVTPHSMAYLFSQLVQDMRIRAHMRDYVECILHCTAVESHFLKYPADIQGISAVLCALDVSRCDDALESWFDLVEDYFGAFATKNRLLIQDCKDCMKELFILNFPEYSDDSVDQDDQMCASNNNIELDESEHQRHRYRERESMLSGQSCSLTESSQGSESLDGDSSMEPIEFDQLRPLKKRRSDSISPNAVHLVNAPKGEFIDMQHIALPALLRPDAKRVY